MSLNTNDDFDMNEFVNFDQGFHSPDSVRSPTFSKSESHSTADPRAVTHQSEHRHYSGPSHDYAQYKQQTGLPTGAVQHLGTVDYFSRTSDFNNRVKPTLFGAAQFGTGYNSGINLEELDAGPSSGLPAYLFPDESTGDDFVDPTVIDTAPEPPAAVRVWPGMHSQQAQQAKAEAIATQQRQRQLQQQQRQQELSMQQQLPTNFEQTVRAVPAQSDSRTGSDAQMDDQISRLLNQMRQGSNASDDDEVHRNNEIGQSARMRRDDDDMDEDERLLASEEGKKLSSKERRQLRNKVSARAFRSRRKEYITQLEGEVAVKTSEANDLKQQNRELMEQNDQLTRLTRAMLSHPSFQNFMSDYSNNPSILDRAQQTSFAGASAQQNSSAPAPAPAPVKQEPNAQQGESTHVGLAAVPENNLNFSMLNLGNGHWDNTHNGGFNFQQPQVFSVFELSQPSMDELRPAALSGKTEEPITFEPCLAEVSKDIPAISSPLLEHPVEFKPDVLASADVLATTTNSGLDLYDDSPVPTPTQTVLETARLLEHSLSSKASAQLNLRVSENDGEASAIKTVERMFASLEPVYKRIQLATAILPE